MLLPILIIAEIIPESFEAIFWKLYNFDNFLRRRMSDHNKITLAIKYLVMSNLGDDVISHVTIAKLVFFAAVARFHHWVKIWGFGCVEHLKITSLRPEFKT